MFESEKSLKKFIFETLYTWVPIPFIRNNLERLFFPQQPVRVHEPSLTQETLSEERERKIQEKLVIIKETFETIKDYLEAKYDFVAHNNDIRESRNEKTDTFFYTITWINKSTNQRCTCTLKSGLMYQTIPELAVSMLLRVGNETLITANESFRIENFKTGVLVMCKNAIQNNN